MNDLSNFGEAGVALAGLLSWLFGNRELDDQEFIEAHEEVHRSVVSGDPIYYGDEKDHQRYNSHELRDQLTPDQMEALQNEYELRRMGGSRN